MKQLNFYLLLLVVLFCSAGKVPKKPTKLATTGNDVLLVYSGRINGSINIEIGYHVEMDSLIGFRCDIVFENASQVLSHVGIFYKFSSPNQAVFYNFISHEVSVENNFSSADKDAGLVAIGTEQIDSFTCTHLQYKDNTSVQNFYMSNKVPGYQNIVKVLKNISPSLPEMSINGNIFQWGGLVRLSRVDTESDGKTTKLFLTLSEATSNMAFPASDFDVPSN